MNGLKNNHNIFPESRRDSHLFIYPVFTRLESIPITHKGVLFNKLKSDYVENLLKRHGGDKEIRKTLRFFKDLDCENYCHVVSQKGGDDMLWKIYSYLKFHKPSGLEYLLKIDVIFYKNENGKFIDTPGSSGASIWNFKTTALDEPLILYNSNAPLIKNGFNQYINSSQKYLHKLVSLYGEAMNNDGYLRFLVLMMLIESLIFDDDKQGIRYKIRRFCAVLLGDTIDESERIYKDIGTLYNIRSEIVHSAKFDKLLPKMVEYLSLVSSELINTLILLKCDHKDALYLTTKYGFGQRKLIFKERNVKLNKRFFDSKLKITFGIKADE